MEFKNPSLNWFIKIIALLRIFADSPEFSPSGNMESGNEKISLLTDFTDGLHPIELPKFDGKTESMNNLRLHFKMFEGFCHSDEGLLICYSSQLNKKIGAKFSQKFKSGWQAENSSIAGQCKEKHKKIEGHKAFGDDEKWHGILLRQDNDASRNFTLELSLTNKKYHLENVKEFTIDLSVVPTRLIINGDIGKNDSVDDEMALYMEFFEAIGSGSFLADFLGLWALRLDLLPIGNKSLSLYVYRSCKCSTKVWFLTDSSVQEENIEWGKLEYENATEKCPVDEIGQDQLKLTEPLKDGEILNISVELMKNGNQQYEIRLIHVWNEKAWKSYASAIIDELMNINHADWTNPVENWKKYNYGDLQNITIYFGSEHLHLESVGRSATYNLSGFKIENLMNENNAGKFTIQIHQHEYFVDIGFMDQIVVNAYWLYNWWDQLRVNMLKFRGVNVLEPPNIIKNERNLPKPGLPPYIFKLPEELLGNQTIVLRALMPEKVQMNVGFFYNTRQYTIISGNFDYIVGEFVFQLSIHLSSEKYNELMQIWIADPDPREKKRLGYPKRHNFTKIPLEPAKPFELHIRLPPRTFDAVDAKDKQIVSEEYTIHTSYNVEITKFDIDKTLFPLWKINTIVIDKIQLLETPTIQNLFDDKEENSKSTDYSINIRQMNSAAAIKDGAVNLLLPGELITIRGRVPVGAQEFCINFCFRQDNCMFEDKDKIGDHPINSQSQIGDIILHIRVILNATAKPDEWNLMKINSWLRGSEKWQKEAEPRKHSLRWGDEFMLRVKIPEDNWVFHVQLDENDGPLVLEAKQTECVPESDEICRMPPWTVEHLQIYGDVNISRADITRENHRNMLTTLPFVRQFENGLELGRKIVIDGEFNGDQNMPDDKVLFRIGLYHDGIGNFEWIRKNIYVGEALLQMDFLNNGQVAIFSYANRYREMEKDHYVKKILWHRQKQVHVEILAKKGKTKYYYEIRINEESTGDRPFQTVLPVWAADYLYIDNVQNGMFKLLEEPKY